MAPKSSRFPSHTIPLTVTLSTAPAAQRHDQHGVPASLPISSARAARPARSDSDIWRPPTPRSKASGTETTPRSRKAADSANDSESCPRATATGPKEQQRCSEYSLVE